MEQLDSKYKLKKFLMAVFRDGIGQGNNLIDNEYVRVFQNNKSNSKQLELGEEFKEYSKTTFFKNIDDIVEFTFAKNIYYENTFFNLCTTDGKAGTNENLINRYALGFDFDKKELGQGFNYKDIINLFTKIGLHYHILVDSGNGFHVYVLINKTNNIKLVSEVTNTLINKLGADKQANLSTQVLRVPYTYNIKNTTKQVKIIHQDKNIYRYDIEKLAKKYCKDVKTVGNTNTKYILDSKLPNCIVDILKNGSKDGHKNLDLQKIVVTLRLRNKSLSQVISVAREWNYISQNSLSNSELEYQVKYMYEKLKTVNFGCTGCEFNSDCWNKIESDFIYSDEDTLFNMPHKHSKDLKYKNRKGVKIMTGNQLFIYNVLLNNKDRELNIDDIMELITYKRKKKVKNIVMSEKTLRKTLKELEHNDYITATKGNARAGIKDTYHVKEVRCNIDKQYTISYFATMAVIWGIISTEELRLYTHMRYKQDLLVKDYKIKGNILRINQEELAKDLGVTQQRISDMIESLLDTKILDIWETKINDRGFMYYTYRLNK
ncbi:TPA: replication protein RepA [Clostridioides difficile]